MASRFSKLGAGCALLFLILFGVLVAAHLYSTYTNVADSGESAILPALFGLPWLLWLHWVLGSAAMGRWGPLLFWLLPLLNALLLYLLCGGPRRLIGKGRD